MRFIFAYFREKPQYSAFTAYWTVNGKRVAKTVYEKAAKNEDKTAKQSFTMKIEHIVGYEFICRSD
jgi:hypothetical protein